MLLPLFISILSPQLIFSDFFTDILINKTNEQETASLITPKNDTQPLPKEVDYHHLLPSIDEKNPHLSFLESRGSADMSLTEQFLAMITKAFFTPIFIETGTYLGDTTIKASRHFKRVYTIELSEKLYSDAKKRFKKFQNIDLIQGDSCKVLASIMRKLKDPALFFLDAHFSMGPTAKGSENTPILAELEEIKKSGLKNSIIIVDDIRMFYKSITSVEESFFEGYPTLEQIIEKILEINVQYQCALVYDALIAFPANQKITVSPLVHAITMSRLYDGKNFEIEEILQAELHIAHAKGKEQVALKNLADSWTEVLYKKAGLARHIPFWYGILLLGNEFYKEASHQFGEAKERGLSDWRLDLYLEMAKSQCPIEMFDFSFFKKIARG